MSSACSSGSKRNSDHPGDFPGLEEEEKAGEGWNMFIFLRAATANVSLRTRSCADLRLSSDLVLSLMVPGGQSPGGDGEKESRL